MRWILLRIPFPKWNMHPLQRKLFAEKKVFTRIPTPLRPLGKDYMHPTAGETMWRKSDSGDWFEVCAFCGGNCGQCGTSVGMGVPASMSFMVHNLLNPGDKP